MMNRVMLEEALNRENIAKDLFSLNGGLPNESFCLNHIDELWEVYYSERGVKSGI